MRQMGIYKSFFVNFFILCSPFCQCFENFCPIKSISDENWYLSTVPNVTCVKQLNCSIYEKMSSPKAAFTMSLESAQITLDEEGLWVQLKLRNQDESPHPEAAYTAYIAFNIEVFCYKFTIPAFVKKYVFLPSIQVQQPSPKTLKALTWVYETSSSGRSQLVLLQANQYSLKDFPKKKSIRVNHLSKRLSVEELSLKLAFASPCAFALKAFVHETSHNHICSTSGAPMCKATSDLQNKHIWQQVSLNCQQTFFKANRTYCIQTVFSPLGACSSTYPELSTEIAYFQSRVKIDTLNEKCKRWNASVTVSLVSSKIRVQFSPLNENLGCFSCFRVLLYKVGEHSCFSNFRVLLLTKMVMLDSNKEGEVTFKNLSTGDYCPEIEPCVKPVLRRSTIVVSILEAPSSAPFRLHDNVDILLASAALLSVAAIAARLQFRRRKKKKEVEILAAESLPATSFPPLVVWVLEGGRGESGLLGLLRRCFGEEGVQSGVGPFLDDLVGWGKELASYQCPAMGDPRDSGQRFVFVQDGRPPDPYTIRGKVFSCALRALLSLCPERCQHDYCHFFVVQLGPPCKDGTGQLVPLKRYTPDDLLDLCLDLGFPQQQRPELQRLLGEYCFSPRELLGRT